jgi:BASS family bile acid:Na+ symporter
MTLAAVFFLQYRREIADNFAVLGLSGALLILLAMLCSSGMSRLSSSGAAVRRTIVIEVGMQNAAQAIMLAGVVFHSGEMALPAIVYALLMNVILLTYVYIIRKKIK